MPFQCYTPRASLRSAMIGGLFISADGARRIVPDQWLTQAELLHGARLLRLSYSFCSIEIAGQCLEPIFEDAGTGKLGAIHVASANAAPGGQLWVTSIIVIVSESSFSEFDRECSNA
jgi:hypothetical protein